MSAPLQQNGSVYGFLAEFDSPHEVMVAAKRAYSEGYRKLDAYSPFPVHGLSEAIGFHRDNVALATLIGGIIGGLTGYGLQYWVNLFAYPVNIAGRPPNSWPAFIIITYELTILFAGLTAAIAMLAMNGLPKPYNSLFNSARFERASRDKFFICIESEDPKFDAIRTRAFLEGLRPASVSEVPY